MRPRAGGEGFRRAVLGVDAAWTETEPSGIALAVETETGWRLVAAVASYDHYLGRARGKPVEGRPAGSYPDAGALVGASHRLCGKALDCVAIDMPVGPNPIVGRRACDNRISSVYGARKAAVHSPSATRPGPISDHLRAGFEAVGLSVCTALPADGVIEVYPHAALIEFMREAERLPYKAAKTLTYWPGVLAEQRHARLRAVWARIVGALDRRIAGVAATLPVPAPETRGWALKAFEDKLDAVVCAAVAIAAQNGEVKVYGDAEGAIWVPDGVSTA
jgi:predicted RNase H-like nuclease